MRLTHVAAPSVVGIVLVLLAACGSDDDGDGTSTIPPAVRDAVLSTTDPSEPLVREEYYRRLNEVMVGCMGEAGFEFVPYTPPRPSSRPFELSESEFRRAYGFGMSTLIDQPPTQLAPTAASEDPNQAVIEQLDPAAQAAYREADVRCRLRVFDEVGPSPDPGTQIVPAYFAELEDQAIELMQADPRVGQARADSRACMAGRGYAQFNGDEIVGHFAELAMPFVQAFQSGRAALEAQGRDVTGIRAEDVLAPDQMSELRELQQAEIAAAVAQWECNQDYVELQQQLIDEYLDQLVSQS